MKVGDLYRVLHGPYVGLSFVISRLDIGSGYADVVIKKQAYDTNYNCYNSAHWNISWIKGYAYLAGSCICERTELRI